MTVQWWSVAFKSYSDTRGVMQCFYLYRAYAVWNNTISCIFKRIELYKVISVFNFLQTARLTVSPYCYYLVSKKIIPTEAIYKPGHSNIYSGFVSPSSTTANASTLILLSTNLSPRAITLLESSYSIRLFN